MKYTVLGAGLMGGAVARSLGAAGFDVALWNRTVERSQQYAGGQVTAVADLGSALDSADAVIVLVSDCAAARQVLGADLAGVRGKDVINLMTVSPEEALAFAADVTAVGGRYLSGAIEAYPADIGTESGFIYLAGDDAAWTSHQAAVLAVAPASVYLGDRPEQPCVIDAGLAGALNSAALGAVCEALTFLKAHDVDLTGPELGLATWLDTFKGQVLSLAAAVESGEFATTEATISVFTAAVRNWRTTMLRSGLRASVMTAHLHNLEVAEAAGHGDLGFAAQVLTMTAGGLPAEPTSATRRNS